MGSRIAHFWDLAGGGKRDRTAHLLHAMQALSQLSYTPTKVAHYTGRHFPCKERGNAIPESRKVLNRCAEAPLAFRSTPTRRGSTAFAPCPPPLRAAALPVAASSASVP